MLDITYAYSCTSVLFTVLGELIFTVWGVQLVNLSKLKAQMDVMAIIEAKNYSSTADHLPLLLVSPGYETINEF